MSDLEQLSQDAAVLLAQCLQLRDLLALSAVSKAMKSVVSDAGVWRQMEDRHSAHVPWEPHLSNPCPRLAFKEAMLYRRRFRRRRTINWGGRRVRVHVRLTPVPPGLSKAQATKTFFGIDGRAVGQHTQYGNPTLYRFHKVYHEEASNAAVFEGSVFESFRALISGVSSAVIVAGASGSGKTHTTFGHEDLGAGPSHHAKGLVTLLCEKVFRTMMAERDQGSLQGFELRLSVVQVCSQRRTEVFDLLDSDNRLVEVRSVSPGPSRRSGSPGARPANGPTRFALDPRALKPVTSIQDIFHLLDGARQAQAQRDGHVVATLHLTQVANPANADVDAAPTELSLDEVVRRHRAGQPIPPFGEGDRQQAPPPTVTAQLSVVDVSASLEKDIMAMRTDLKRVVKTIASNGCTSFRDSILNKILQNSLSSPAGIAVLVTASPAHERSTATRHYLRFGCELAGCTLTTANARYQDEKISRFLREENMNRQAPVGPVA